MANWPAIADRNVQYPNRMKLTVVGTDTDGSSIVDVTPVPGFVNAPGTDVNAALLTGVKDYIDERMVTIPYGGTGATTAAEALQALSAFGDAHNTGVISDLNWSSLYDKVAPGVWLVRDSATGSPHSGHWGNAIIGYAGGNRMFAIVVFDDRQVWMLYGSDAALWEKVSTEWTLLTTVTGSASITLPSVYNEILAIGGSAYKTSITIPKGQTGKVYSGFGFGTATYTSVILTSTTIKLDSIYENGVDVMASAQLSVYYR